MFLRKYLILFIIIIANVSFAEQFNGKVSKIVDGDTIWVKSASGIIKIRLSYIDAPELKQDYGIQSKEYLANLILDKNVEIHSYRRDRYKRVIGEIYIHNNKESVFINAKLLKSGHAWVYKRYRRNPYLMNLENFARINKNGIWNSENPVKPWEYRKK
tara:strand:- start:4781 stop:5254 length:474 start_codon:yes stop_codon:yes gene_type:complete